MRPLWQLLLLTRDPTEFVQLSCEECFALLEYDADLLAAGVPREDVRLAANRHLALCKACQKQIDKWIEQYAPPALNMQ